jgi:hypothetical protein
MSRGKKVTEQGSAWFPDALPALLRARRRAEETARRTRTSLIVSKQGKPVAVAPPARVRRKRS